MVLGRAEEGMVMLVAKKNNAVGQAEFAGQFRVFE
jgi:hypothetical protein